MTRRRSVRSTFWISLMMPVVGLAGCFPPKEQIRELAIGSLESFVTGILDSVIGNAFVAL